ESLSAEALEEHQLARFNAMIASILPANRFYADKLGDLGRPLESLSELADLPFTFKDELLGPRQTTASACNRTYDLERYTRYHQTSGTRGRPMIVLDTIDDWQWWIECWQYVFDTAEIGPADRVLMAFSFG